MPLLFAYSINSLYHNVAQFMMIQINHLVYVWFQLACKYITDIVTIYNQEIPGQVKFDLRFVVMLASVKPLKLYVHEKFYCRCAVK